MIHPRKSYRLCAKSPADWCPVDLFCLIICMGSGTRGGAQERSDKRTHFVCVEVIRNSMRVQGSNSGLHCSPATDKPAISFQVGSMSEARHKYCKGGSLCGTIIGFVTLGNFRKKDFCVCYWRN